MDLIIISPDALISIFIFLEFFASLEAVATGIKHDLGNEGKQINNKLKPNQDGAKLKEIRPR